MTADPWAAPAPIPTEFPTVASLRGRLVQIKPLRQDTVPNNLNPGSTQERITADVTLMDGMGPVPGMKNGHPTGQMFAGPEFRGMWLQSEVIVKQLADALATGGMVLARIDTRTPGTQPIKGNPWGLIEPTEQDRAIARQVYASLMVGQAQAPAPAPAPQQYAPQPVPLHQAPQAQPQYAPAAAPQPQFQQPSPVQYTQPQQAPAPANAVPTPTPGKNPFA